MDQPMGLTVLERLLLLEILPTEGDLTTLRIVRTLREALSFSEAEHADFGIRVADGRVTWNAPAARPKDVEIGPTAHRLIVTALERLNTAEKLRAEHLDLYERFIPAKET